MLRLEQIKLPVEHEDVDIRKAILKRLKIPASNLIDYRVIKRSIDARKHNQIRFIYSVDVEVKEESSLLSRYASNHQIRKISEWSYREVVSASQNLPDSNTLRPVVVGAGPCGYFAALLLAQMGLRPLLLERGQEIKDRTCQTFGFWKGKCSFNPESNVQFGEGGAGTFSDGKLYSQKTDPKRYGRKVLEELVRSGASSEILTLARPHIGTFKLATVVRGMRARILELGGEIRFNTRVDDVLLESHERSSNSRKQYQIVGLKLQDGTEISSRHVVFAVGHSARDSFLMLEKKGVLLQPKLFSIGFRVEHPQLLIDKARWGSMAGHPKLGPAEYKLVYHSRSGRCVYSFCMCPGGLVVGSTSEKDCVVTNGMSQHSRNERNANSALVVNLLPIDFQKFERWSGDPMAGIALQRSLEKKAFLLGGGEIFCTCAEA